MKAVYITISIFLVINQVIAASDSLPTLSPDQFMERVKAHHPIALQAGLQVKKGALGVQKARGGFDPKLQSNTAQKYFDGKTYYRLQRHELKLPTYYGVDVTAGYQLNDGQYLNPQNQVPEGGQWQAGISVPLGQGLWIDERRTALKQAKLYLQITEAEQQLMLNELLYEAGTAYWNWFQAYHTQNIYASALQLAKVRYQNVKASSALGDRPYIDTVEAGIQVQNRMLNWQEATLTYQNASAYLATFLWDQGTVPLLLKEQTIPLPLDSVQTTTVDPTYWSMLDSLAATHPKLNQLATKIDWLKAEQQWRKEQLKPQLNLKYQALSSWGGNLSATEVDLGDHIWGLSFSMPLLLRKERANWQTTNVNMQEAILEQQQVTAQQSYQVLASLNTWATTAEQTIRYARTTQDARSLLDGERNLFLEGESSLFMINSRELGYIQTQQKYLELLTKNQKSRLAAQYALGVL